MTILTKLFFILGIAFISYGLARWSIVPDIHSKQDEAFRQFITAHANQIEENFSYPTNVPIKRDFYLMETRVKLSGGMYPGWPQAIVPCALGLMLLAVGYYLAQKR